MSPLKGAWWQGYLISNSCAIWRKLLIFYVMNISKMILMFGVCQLFRHNKKARILSGLRVGDNKKGNYLAD